MHRFANPSRFVGLADRILPWSLIIMAGTLIAGAYYAFFNSPADYQQGETVRIMYIHVPAAWMALFTYMVVAISGIAGLIWKHPLADLAGRAAAPLGAMFAGLTLATGSLWGKPMWGTWWVWDARLTSMLILFFLYLGYIALWQAIEDEAKAAKASAILAIVGLINIPIIKFSVDWWNTLHQPASVIRLDGPTIDGSMLTPLFLMFIAFKAYFVTVLLWRMKAEIAARKISALRRAQAAQSTGPATVSSDSTAVA